MICEQTMIQISIAEMDSLGSITQDQTPHTIRLMDLQSGGEGRWPKNAVQAPKLPLSAGQHDFWSNDGSIFNFDYIRLDTLHSKIILIRGCITPPRGGGQEAKKLESERLSQKRRACQKSRTQLKKYKNVALRPYLIFQPVIASQHDLWSNFDCRN